MLVKLLEDFSPGWQAGITVELEDAEAASLAKEGKVELLEEVKPVEPIVEPVEEVVEEVVVEEEPEIKPKKKSRKKR